MNKLGKRLTKSDIKLKIVKKSKTNCAMCEKTTERAKLCSNTVYFEIGVKNNHAAKPINFSLYYLNRRDQNQFSNLTSKIMELCEQPLSLKKLIISLKFSYKLSTNC